MSFELRQSSDHLPLVIGVIPGCSREELFQGTVYIKHQAGAPVTICRHGLRTYANSQRIFLDCVSPFSNDGALGRAVSDIKISLPSL